MQFGDGGDRKDKAETECFSGVWLGPANSSSETLMGITRGVAKAYSIKRFGMTENLTSMRSWRCRVHPSADQDGAGGASHHAGHEAGSGRSSPKENVCHDEAFRKAGAHRRLRRLCEVVYGNEK